MTAVLHPSSSDALSEESCGCWPRWLAWDMCGVRSSHPDTDSHPTLPNLLQHAKVFQAKDTFGYQYQRTERRPSVVSEPGTDAFMTARSQGSEDLADDQQISVDGLEHIELEWQVAERGLDAEELEKLREMRDVVVRHGLDEHPACELVPHSQRAITLLRFLRARKGDISKAVAMLESALDWRSEFGFDRKVAAWRSEWEAGVSPRTRLLRQYDFIQFMGNDHDGLPVYLHRFSQGDPGGIAKAIGEETLLLHLLRILDDCFAASQEWLLKTARIPPGFVDVFDMGNYGLVPNWLPRCLAAAIPYTKIAPILDNVFPERVRAIIAVRTPMAFPIIWRLVLPLIPESTRVKIRIRGFQASSWKEDMAELLPENIIPLWLQVDDSSNFANAKPWGGIVPKDVLLQE